MPSDLETNMIPHHESSSPFLEAADLDTLKHMRDFYTRLKEGSENGTLSALSAEDLLSHRQYLVGLLAQIRQRKEHMGDSEAEYDGVDKLGPVTQDEFDSLVNRMGLVAADVSATPHYNAIGEL